MFEACVDPKKLKPNYFLSINSGLQTLITEPYLEAFQTYITGHFCKNS